MEQYKAKADEISILEDFVLDAIKTKDYLKVLKDLSVDTKKTLMIIPEKNQNLALSSRNVKNAKIVLANNINTYEVLHADQLLVFEGSLQKIEEILN